ncbi:MAG: hypothetical protein RJA99_1347 [Pseudomonadota bacterium]|jgi:hypothetical protein
MTPFHRGLPAACIAAALAALSGCGGGGGADGTSASIATGGGASGTGSPLAGGGASGTGSPLTGTPLFAEGVMARGSVILNGVRYDDTAAQVTDDRGRGVAQLADGMRVKLRGRIADDGVSGTTDRVSIEPELRGTVGAVDTTAVPPIVVVGGVPVRVDDTTAWANGPTLATLASLVGQRVEVHGLRDATGTIRASRVEAALPASVSDGLKGPITMALSGSAFAIAGGAGGSVTVTLGGAPVFLPAGSACTASAAALSIGRVVEVQGRFTGPNAFVADRVECEDLADDSAGVRPSSGSRNEVEGYVSAFDAAASTFSIGSTGVSWTSGTQFRGGVATDLANGRRVEVDGTLTGGRLVAREVSFKQARAILQGSVVGYAAGGRSFTVLGRTVQLTDLSDIGATLANGARVEVRGAATGAATLVADEVRDGSGNGGRDILQAPVTAKTASSITLLGQVVTLPATPPSEGYTDSNGTAYASLTAFLDAITAQASGGTVVKVRWRNGAIDGAEIER